MDKLIIKTTTRSCYYSSINLCFPKSAMGSILLDLSVCFFFFSLFPFQILLLCFWSFCLFDCFGGGCWKYFGGLLLSSSASPSVRRRRRLAWILASFLIFFFAFSGVQLLNPVFWTSSFCGYAVVAASLKS